MASSCFRIQVKKILDTHTDNSFQFIMKETLEFCVAGKISQDELQAFYHVARIVSPISWGNLCKQAEESK